MTEFLAIDLFVAKQLVGGDGGSPRLEGVMAVIDQFTVGSLSMWLLLALILAVKIIINGDYADRRGIVIALIGVGFGGGGLWFFVENGYSWLPK